MPHTDFDLYRYYEFFNQYDEREDFFKTLNEVINYNFDFVYFLTFMFLKQIGAAPNFANGIYVSLYYGYMVSLVYTVSKGSFKNIFIWSVLFAVLTVPIIYSLSISRTVASLALFFIALTFDARAKPLLTVLILLVSIFTHIGMALFIIPTFAMLKLTRNFVWRRWYVYIYLPTFLLLFSSASWMNSVSGLFYSIPFFDQFSRYEIYLEQTTTIIGDLPYYDVIPVAWLLFAGVFMFVRTKQHTPYTITCGLLLLAFALFFNYSTMFTQRTVMVISPFIAVLFFEFQKHSKKKYFGLSADGLLIIGFSCAVYFINLAGYRAYLADSF